jgi:hypothetical protein
VNVLRIRGELPGRTQHTPSSYFIGDQGLKADDLTACGSSCSAAHLMGMELPDKRPSRGLMAPAAWARCASTLCLRRRTLNFLPVFLGGGLGTMARHAVNMAAMRRCAGSGPDAHEVKPGGGSTSVP